MAINMTLEQVEMLVKKAGLSITDKSRNGNNLATTLKLANGCLVHCWDKGTVSCQGKMLNKLTQSYLLQMRRRSKIGKYL